MDYLRSVFTVRRNGNLIKPATAIATTLAAAYAVIWCIYDYKAFMALGPGGVPYNVWGWAFITVWIRPFALSAANTTKVDDYPSTGAHPSIEALPTRKGKRAELGGIAPHRQLSQHPEEKMRQYLSNLFDNIVIENPKLLLSKKSLYERHNTGLFVSDELLNDPESSIPETARTSRGEIGHKHPEMSMHLYLAPADARKVIEKGWAERHRMSVPRTSRYKNMYSIADTYLMIYGPRDEAEMDVVRDIVVNAVRFMTGTEGVKVPGWKEAST